jgi:hypothetical protein
MEEPDDSVGLGRTFIKIGATSTQLRGQNGRFTKKKTPVVRGHPNSGNWAFEGARIIDLQHLLNQMDCPKCGKEMSLRKTVKESQLGLASVFTVECKCGATKRVQSSKQNKQGNYNINISAVIGNLFFYFFFAIHYLLCN